MVRLFVRHAVSDLSSWKQAYVDFEEERQRMGVRGAGLFTGVEDPNDVTVWHDFDSLEAAQAFMASPSLRQAMVDAGVAGEPVVWFATEA